MIHLRILLNVVYIIMASWLLFYLDYDYRLSYINGDGGCCRVLNEIAVSNALIWYTGAILLVTICITLIQLGHLKKYALIYLIPIFFNASIICYDLNIIIESTEDFKKEEWSGVHSIGQAIDIKEQELLINFSDKEVEQLLGVPDFKDEFKMIYFTNGCERLSVQFLDSRVVRVALKCA